MSDSVIGIDIGGTNIRVGLINKDLSIVRKESAQTGMFQNADEMFHYIRQMIENVDFEKKANKIGIALPIPFKDESKPISDATNIPCLENISFPYMKSYFQGYEVCFENDVNVITFLEAKCGAAKNYCQSIYITVSTGIGSGIMLHNHLLHGAHGYAGEIGSMILSDSRKSESTLESLCSGKALEKISQSLYGSVSTVEDLFRKYQMNDAQAVKSINLWIEYFSSAIASLMQTLDPDVIVVGGAVINNNKWLIEKVMGSAKQKVLPNLRDKINIVLSKFGSDAGIIGAGYLILENIKGECIG